MLKTLLKSFYLLIVIGLLISVAGMPVKAQEQTPSDTATATATETPTASATPTATFVPVVCGDGESEPSNNLPWGCVIAVGLQTKASVNQAGDVDYFAFYGKGGHVYRINVNSGNGVDPRLLIQSLNGSTLAANDDAGLGNLNSEATFSTPSDGYYSVIISANGVIVGDYVLTIVDTIPTNTPTATNTLTPTLTGTPKPTSTPLPTQSPVPTEPGEPNNSFDTATPLIAGQSISGKLSPGDSVDWYGLRVKPGIRYQCRVTSTEFDNALQIEQGGQLLSANDDESTASTNALTSWASNVDGLAYVVVTSSYGWGSYQVVCNVAVPTAVPGGGGAVSSGVNTNTLSRSATPFVPATQVIVPSITPSPTITPTVGPQWYPVAPAFQPTSSLTTITILVFYDFNDNGQPEPTEGIAGLSVRAVSFGQFIGWGLTNEQGETTLAITGQVDRVVIPFLNLQQKVKMGQNNQFVFRLEAVKLPTFLPVEAVDG